MPFSISRSSAGACTTSPAQTWQAYLGRRVTITLNCAGITSSRSETSSPIRCLRPPQHAQVLSATSLPVHFPREEIVIDVADKTCACCGGLKHRIGEDVSERLDVIPAQFKEIVTRRPK